MQQKAFILQALTLLFMHCIRSHTRFTAPMYIYTHEQIFSIITNNSKCFVLFNKYLMQNL